MMGGRRWRRQWEACSLPLLLLPAIYSTYCYVVAWLLVCICAESKYSLYDQSVGRKWGEDLEKNSGGGHCGEEEAGTAAAILHTTCRANRRS